MKTPTRERMRRLQEERGRLFGEREEGRSEYLPWVPAAILVQLLTPLAEEIGWCAVARQAGIGQRVLYSIRTQGERVRFDTADKLISRGLGEPDLWHSVPELRAIYEAAV